MNKLLTDYPTAWAVMRKTDPQQHHERCSYRQTNGGVLCDCAASAAFIATVEMQGEKSYSALIIEACQAKKQCMQCGQLCVVYKEPFRKQWITCLEVLKQHGGAMDYKQIAAALALNHGYKEATANNTARMFILSRHWKVIEKAETNSKCPAYQITDYGMRVLHNEESVAEFKWIPARKVDMDTSALPEATYTFARSLEDDNVDDLANKALHVEEAEPITCPF